MPFLGDLDISLSRVSRYNVNLPHMFMKKDVIFLSISSIFVFRMVTFFWPHYMASTFLSSLDLHVFVIIFQGPGGSMS